MLDFPGGALMLKSPRHATAKTCVRAAVQAPGEEECRALLAAAGDAARQLETSIAGDDVRATRTARPP